MISYVLGNGTVCQTKMCSSVIGFLISTMLRWNSLKWWITEALSLRYLWVYILAGSTDTWCKNKCFTPLSDLFKIHNLSA